MKIRAETIYIVENGDKEKQIRLGELTRLVFKDGSYHTGELIEILDRVVTIGRSDGEYAYLIINLRDIEQ